MAEIVPAVITEHQSKFRLKLDELSEMLGVCDDSGFLQLAWAVNMLQNDFGADVRRFLDFPAEAKTSERSSPQRIHEWEIETVLMLLLSKPKNEAVTVYRLTYRYDIFFTMAKAINLLRSIENHEAGILLNDDNVLMEMHRIGHRQFSWQRGFATSERLYRFIFIYGQGPCAEYFEETHGVSVQEFVKIGYFLFVQLHKSPWARSVDVEPLGLNREVMDKALPLFTRSLSEIRTEAKGLIERAEENGNNRIAYGPSIFRRYPIIRSQDGASYISPLPQLIMFRMTAGLYYDICNGPQRLIADANARFERYVAKILSAFFPRFDVLNSQKYGPKKSRLDTPDVLISDNSTIVAVIECKATKLTFEAQYSDDPIDQARSAYEQMIKGIKQIWRFFSHARQGLYSDVNVDPSAHGVLLTLDAWMQVSDGLQSAALARAKEELSDEEDVLEVDMRRIVFCSMQDLADVMFTANEDKFLFALQNARTEKFSGWNFESVHNEVNTREERRDYPFDLSDLLPWMEAFQNDQD